VHRRIYVCGSEGGLQQEVSLREYVSASAQLSEGHVRPQKKCGIKDGEMGQDMWLTASLYAYIPHV
jgi:hypothetical protein